MKDLSSLDTKDYSVLCDSLQIPQNKINNNYVFELYPNPILHIVKDEPNQSLIPLGVCGDLSVWHNSLFGKDIDYNDTINKLSSKLLNRIYTHKLVVCLFDATVQSDKLSDALVFAPAFILYDERDLLSRDWLYRDEKSMSESEVLSKFYTTYAGQFFEGMKKTDKLLRKQAVRCKESEKQQQQGLSTFVERAEMLAQVLSRYDIKNATPFEQDILTNIYDNTFIMLNRCLKENQKALEVEDTKNKHSIKQKLKTFFFKRQSGDISLFGYIQFCKEQYEGLKAKKTQSEIDKQKAEEQALAEERKKRIENFKL